MSELQEPLTEQPDLKPDQVAAGTAPPWPAIGEPVVPEVPADSLLSEMSLEEHEARLKAERVQDRLKRMPGWTLVTGGHAVERVRKLATPMTAAEYAGLVLREAARAKQRVRVGLEGVRVVISVMAPYHGPERGAIDLKQLDFADALV